VLEFITISLLNGVTYGLLLFMVSAGLTLIFGMMGVLNFAHASFYMLGAYFAFTITRYVDFWVGLVVAPILVGLIGVLVERYLLRRVHIYGHAHELLLTFGLAFIFEELVKLFYGDFPVNYSMPDYLRFSAFSVFGADYPFYRLFIAMVAIAMFGALYLLLSRTRAGLVVRAAERLPAMAEALGHNVPLVFMAVFGIGAALAGLGGAVAGAFFPTNPNMALELGVIVFVVVVVGGLGSIEGSLIASLMIGVFSSFAVGLNWSLAGLLDNVGLGVWAREVGGLFTLTLSSISGTVPFLLMLIVLLIRPAGLMGERN
jgi:branched-chain amino acid transport system permease protein